MTFGGHHEVLTTDPGCQVAEMRETDATVQQPAGAI
jgi:hypothetical protein